MPNSCRMTQKSNLDHVDEESLSLFKVIVIVQCIAYQFKLCFCNAASIVTLTTVKVVLRDFILRIDSFCQARSIFLWRFSPQHEFIMNRNCPVKSWKAFLYKLFFPNRCRTHLDLDMNEIKSFLVKPIEMQIYSIAHKTMHLFPSLI